MSCLEDKVKRGVISVRVAWESSVVFIQVEENAVTLTPFSSIRITPVKRNGARSSWTAKLSADLLCSFADWVWRNLNAQPRAVLDVRTGNI